MGRLSETVTSRFKFRQPVYVCELDLSSLLASEERQVHYKPLPRYPSVKRDVTLWLDQGIPLSALREAIDGLDLPEYRTTELVGTYEGANIPEGKRAVTLRIEYRADQRTLRDEEVEERQRGLIAFLIEKFGGEQH
jgi:phenylalanyl-tRNA synthetase beta chain